jgi:hypothetical protein
MRLDGIGENGGLCASAAVTLYLGDCRDLLPELRVDLIIADPPYEQTSVSWDRSAGWLAAAASAADAMWCWLPLRQFAMPPYRGQEFAAAEPVRLTV